MNQPSTNLSGNQMPDDLIDRAIALMQGEAIPTGPSADLIAATLNAIRAPERQPKTVLPFLRRIMTMKFVTTAAGILLLVSVATFVTLTVKSPPSAFGQAIQQVREAHAMSYTNLISINGQQEPVKTKVFVAADGRQRTEGPGKVTTITDAAGQIRITLLDDLKQAIVQDVKDRGAGTAPSVFLAWLQALKTLGNKPDKVLGDKEVDGKLMTGFVATQGNFVFTMWVEKATGAIVRLQYEPLIKDSGYREVTLTDFRLDEKLDESLFSYAVPAGYKVLQQPAVPVVPGGELSIVEALRGYTRRSGGQFPASLTDGGPWAVLFSQDNHDGTIDAETTRVMANLGAITPFLVAMPKQDYGYLGAGKTVAQMSEMIFWYKNSKDSYRAVFGDLSVRDVRADEIPDLQK